MTPIRYLVILSSFIPILATAQTFAPEQPTEVSAVVPATITFQTNPTGLSVIVDGTSHTTPYQTTWTTGSSHTINTTSPQPGATGIQYLFSTWSDGGSQSHSVTAPRNNRTYTATFTTQYYLTMSRDPLDGGTVSPSSGWRNKGQSVSINATANSGYSFGSWSGTGTGSYTGATKAATITMNGPISQTGNFLLVVQPVLSVTPANQPVSGSAGTTTFAVSNTGTGTMNWTASSNQGWATITGGASGTNSGTITVSYTANSSTTTSRTATITVTASGATGSPKTVTLTQAATPPPILSVTPVDRPVSGTAGTTDFAVSNTSAGTMNWTASSDQGWAAITGGASGTNSGTISVSYAENPSSTDSRMATITVTAPGSTGSPRAVTITQAPAPLPVLIPDTTSVSDDFTGPILDARLWNFVNPLGDATLSVSYKELALAVPGGTKHEPWTSGNSAPRVLQNVSPPMNVNEWTVKFNTVPAGSNTTIPMQGMFFEQDSANFVRTDIFSDGVSVYAFAAGFTNGLTNPSVYISVPIPVTSAPVWLRVTRGGTLWRVYCSLEGSTWFTAGSFSHLITLNRVGVFAGNSGTSPEAFTCLVDFFQAALPAKPYLSMPENGASGVTRPVTFSWDTATGAAEYRLQVATDSNFAASVFDSTVVETSGTVTALQQTTEYYWWRVAGKNGVGWGQFSDPRSFSISLSGVAQDNALPDRYALQQNYPNPFNPRTVIRSQLPVASDVRLVVYDMLGREVAILVNERRAAGSYQDTFDGSGLASGTYFYRLTAGTPTTGLGPRATSSGFVATKTLLLVK